MRTRRENFLDVAFDVLPVDHLLSRLGAVTSKSAFQYLVTPNVDHMVRLHKSRADLEGLADAYRTADLCVCDSKVLARLARWRGVQLPVVTGSDLTASLFERVIQDGDHVAIVGGDEAMVDELKRKYPAIRFAQHCPPMGLMGNAAARPPTTSIWGMSCAKAGKERTTRAIVARRRSVRVIGGFLNGAVLLTAWP